MYKQPLPQALDVRSDSVRQFLKGFNSEATKVAYARKLCQFLDAIGITSDELLAEARDSPANVRRRIIDYVEDRRDKVSGSTINQTVVSLKHFFDMNDAEDMISWRKIAKVTPRVRKVGSDRAPTKEEIRRMMGVADTRLRCIILTCVSSGVRVGAFEDLRWGDLTVMRDKADRGGDDSGGDDSGGDDIWGSSSDACTAVRLVIYRGSDEEYVTFASPECYEALCKYREMREGAGEEVTAMSPLIRDAWDSQPYRRSEDRKKDPVVATPLASKTISNMMYKHLRKIKMRNKTHADAWGHDFKQIHGFRKFFKTNAGRTMKTDAVEKLMGHADSYYKPSEEDLLEQYVAAVPDLTISRESELQNEIKTQDMRHIENMLEYDRQVAALNKSLAEIEDSVRNVRDEINPPKTVD